MQYKGIIYDLDGTLLHSIEDIADAANFVLSESGFKTHPTSDYVKWIGKGAYQLIEGALPENYRQEDKVPEYHLKFVTRYTQNWNVKSRLFEGIPEILDKLENRGFAQSVLSNKPHHLTVNVSDFYLKPWTFVCVFGQRNEVPKKPDPAAALEIAEITKIKNGEYLFIGDSSTDMKTARAAGMLAIGVSWGYDTKQSMVESGADYIVDSPKELLSLIEKLN
ncbi:MAG: HAD family hydrolase [Bacteroidales bacterium]|nr:HAD family hydrolase [Bacteroidales bacterium]